MNIVLLVLLLVLMAQVRNLGSQLDTMQSQLRRLTQGTRPIAKPKPIVVEEPKPIPFAMHEAVKPPVAPTEHLKPRHEDYPVAEKLSLPSLPSMPKEDLEKLLGRVVLPFLGLFTLVGAIGFFVAWSISNGYLGPKGQIAIASFVSAGLVLLADHKRFAWPNGFQFVSAIGLGGGLLTAYLAHGYYAFIGAGPALALLSGIAAVGVILSLRYDARVLAISSLLAGAGVPFLIHAPASSPLVFGIYGFVLAAIAGVLCTRKDWPRVALLGLGIGLAYAVLVVLSADPATLSLLATALFALVLPATTPALVQAAGNRTDNSFVPVQLSVMAIVGSALAYVTATGALPHLGWLGLLPAAGLAAAAWRLPKTAPQQDLAPLQIGSLVLVLLAFYYEFGTTTPLLHAVVFAGMGLAIAATRPTQSLSWFAHGLVALSLPLAWADPQAVLGLVHLGLAGAATWLFVQDETNAPGLPFYLGGLLVAYIGWAFFALSGALPTAWDWLPFGITAVLAIGLGQVRHPIANELARLLALVLGAIAVIMVGMGVGIFQTKWLLPAGAIGIVLTALALVTTLVTQPTKHNLGRYELLAVGTFTALVGIVIVTGGQAFEAVNRSLFYGICAGGMLGYGFLQNDRIWRLTGLVSLALVALRLYAIDVWGLSVSMRIVAFTVLGIIFLVAGLSYRRK